MTLAAKPGGDQRAEPGRPGDAAGGGAALLQRMRALRLPVSAVAVVAAAGVLVVAAADTAGRLGYASSPWADRAYWLGQALIVAPVAARLFSRRRLVPSETLALVVILTVAEYLVKVCYSPALFTYGDELMHWRSLQNILQTGKLFSPNSLLPISPYYPGLEEATSALVSVTGLSAFDAGLIIAGTAHLLFACLLYVLFYEISGSCRIAGIGMLVYAANPLFPSFDSMFVYQTLALPFLGIALLAVKRLTAPDAARRGGWFAVAVLAALATVVTHNVTSYVLVATLEIITLGSLLARRRSPAVAASLLAVLSAAAFTAWVVFVAPMTVTYLQPVAGGVIQGIQHLLSGASSGTPPTSSASGPLGDRALSGLAVLIISALLPVGWWQVWRHHRREPWIVAMAVGSVGWGGVIAVRLFVANGSELAGRASTFVYVPVGFIAAIAAVHLLRVSTRAAAGEVPGARATRRRLRLPLPRLRRPLGRLRVPPRWRGSVVVTAAVVGAVIVGFDGLANGWPPYWERLPGPHQVAGSERSVGPLELASARWALAELGPGNRFATDVGDFAVLGSYGDQFPVQNVAYLYTSPTFTRSDQQQAAGQSVRYLLADRRLSTALPISGGYFPGTSGPAVYTHPLPLADLTKYNRVPGVARIYDSGSIVIYHLGQLDYAG